jgi:hypothetical protein
VHPSHLLVPGSASLFPCPHAADRTGSARHASIIDQGRGAFHQPLYSVKRLTVLSC